MSLNDKNPPSSENMQFDDNMRTDNNVQFSSQTTENFHLQNTRTWRDYAWLVGKGMLMGSADVIPGVSGGTVALLVGIYQELIESISLLTQPQLWQMVVQREWRKAWKYLPWQFLLAVGTGIFVAVLVFAGVLEHLMQTYPVLVWSAFFGLIAASAIVVMQKVSAWRTPHYVASILAGLFAFWLVGLSPMTTTNNFAMLFFSGFIAVCALILPGISGAFILLLLGKYSYIINAVNTRQLLPLAVVGIGAVAGLLSMARLLRWTLARYFDITMAILAGFMVGSLRKVWPWQSVMGKFYQNHLPPSLPNALVAVLVAGVACGGVLLLERVGKKKVLVDD